MKYLLSYEDGSMAQTNEITQDIKESVNAGIMIVIRWNPVLETFESLDVDDDGNEIWTTIEQG